MLLPLMRDFGQKVSVALYHTPDLRGIVKRVLPERYNETVGVQHMKVYLFDDTIIMSGYVLITAVMFGLKLGIAVIKVWCNTEYGNR